jgi:hypothetical protein
MTIWPELRAAFSAQSGRDLVDSTLDEFLGWTLTYSINATDVSGKRREILLDVIWGTLNVQSDEFDDQAISMLDQLDSLEQDLRRGVE